MARIFSKINNKINYLIFDTKNVSLLQYYYLKQNNLDVGFKYNCNFVLKNKLNEVKTSFKNNSLFIANWSLSETPLKYRNKILKIINNYQFVLISFQEKFEEINNIHYFKNLAKKMKKKYSVTIVSNEFYKGNFFKKQNHYFLIAKKL